MNKLFINKKCLVRNFTAALSFEFTIISIVLLFFSLENDFGIVLDTFFKKSLPIIIAVMSACIFAVIRTCTYRKNKIIDETQRTITLRYGNLWKYAFPKFSRKHRIIVVNVNTAFDVIVDSPGTHDPLVSSATIHGQWIEEMKKRGISEESLNANIKKKLQDQKVVPVTINHKNRGNIEEYPKGTVVQYNYRNTTFYLLALSKFDEKNNAQNTQEDLRNTILELINFIGNNSQGIDVYIPVMGSGHSRTGIDDQTALELLTSNLKLNRNTFRGNINVVVYEGNRDKITIEG